MQTNIEPKIPTEEFRSFLIAARSECINSVLLDDFNVRIAILKEQPEFMGLLSNFSEETTAMAIDKLQDSGEVLVYRSPDSMEVMLAKLPEIVPDSIYFQVAQSYRMVEPNQKSPKVKGI